MEQKENNNIYSIIKEKKKEESSSVDTAPENEKQDPVTDHTEEASDIPSEDADADKGEKTGFFRGLYEKYLGLNRSLRLIIGAGLLSLVIIFVFGLIAYNGSYSGYTIIRQVEKTDSLAVNYQTTDNGIIRYNKDGASYTRDLENIIWNQSYEMVSAKVVFCGEYMAIGDIFSNSIRIFNEDGQQGVITTMYPIEDLCVAEQGVVYAVLSDGKASYIDAYDKNGTELLQIKATIENTGYPQRIAVSDDGTKLAVGYLKTDGGQINTRLLFYHFGEAGKGQVDNIIGEETYNELIGSLKFINDDTVIGIFEDNMRIYNVRNSVEKEAELGFLAEIKSVFSNDKYSGFVFSNFDRVTEDDPVEEDKKLGEDPFRIIIYTTSGREYSDFTFDFNYETIHCSDTEIIMISESSCAIYDFRGKKRYEHSFDEKVLQFMPMKTPGEYILVTKTKVLQISLN